MKRVVRLVPVLDFGGVEAILEAQAKLIDRTRFELRVCTFWKPGAVARRIEKAGVSVDVLGVDPAVRNPAATLAVHRYLRRHRPDILHATVGEANFHGAIAGAMAGVPVRLVEEVGIPAHSPVARRFFGALYKTVHGVLGCAAATCHYLVEEGAPRSRTICVPNCADGRFFEDSGPLDLAGPIRGVTVGRLVAVKNQEVLLQAFAKLRDEGVDGTLCIVGEGPLHPYLQALIQRLELGDRVTLLGYSDDVQPILREANLFLMPSFTEGTSIAVIEAMASHLPVVGSTAEGVLEVMGDDVEGWTVEPADTDGWVDALRRFDQMSTAERANVGERNYQRALEAFSPTAHIGRLEGVYDELSRGRL